MRIGKWTIKNKQRKFKANNQIRKLNQTTNSKLTEIKIWKLNPNNAQRHWRAERILFRTANAPHPLTHIASSLIDLLRFVASLFASRLKKFTVALSVSLRRPSEHYLNCQIVEQPC